MKSGKKRRPSHRRQAILHGEAHLGLESDYSEIQIIGAGVDAVDFALVNQCKRGDIVVTQDYGDGNGTRTLRCTCQDEAAN